MAKKAIGIDIGGTGIKGAIVDVKNGNLVGDGTPFPTTYYLTHRGATAAVSTLEASGLMAVLQQRLADEPELAAAYQKAHEAYIADRDKTGAELGLDVPEIAGISAGGMPTRVKCLHALIGHSLAAGPGVNPIGDIALEACSWSPNRCVCESN